VRTVNQFSFNKFIFAVPPVVFRDIGAEDGRGWEFENSPALQGWIWALAA